MVIDTRHRTRSNGRHLRLVSPVSPTVIILEGTDGVGKTTYAKWLAASLNGAYRHAGPPTKKTVEAEYLQPIVDHLSQHPDRRLILDRWHLGEMVWPDIFDRESLFAKGKGSTWDRFDKLNDSLSSLGPGLVEIILIVRSAEGITRTLAQRGESVDNIVNSQRGQVGLFDAAMSVSDIPVRIVNSDDLPTAPRRKRR